MLMMLEDPAGMKGTHDSARMKAPAANLRWSMNLKGVKVVLPRSVSPASLVRPVPEAHSGSMCGIALNMEFSATAAPDCLDCPLTISIGCSHDSQGTQHLHQAGRYDRTFCCRDLCCLLTSADSVQSVHDSPSKLTARNLR